MPAAHCPTIAKWHAHLHHPALNAEMRSWLTHERSLTARLVASCGQFRVQLLQQHVAACVPDEWQAIGLARPGHVMERNVLLRCDDRAVVYAHTALPLSANASHWPLFASLGNRSLGTTLFYDPLVRRGALQFARLRAQHPLMRRIQALSLVDSPTPSLWARRCLFTRRGSCLLVTEVFLPAVSAIFQGSQKDKVAV